MGLPEAHISTQPERDKASTGARWSPVGVLKQHSHQTRFGTGASGDLGEAIAEVLSSGADPDKREHILYALLTAAPDLLPKE